MTQSENLFVLCWYFIGSALEQLHLIVFYTPGEIGIV